MTKRKARARANPLLKRRSRGVPIQVYVSKTEHAQLTAIAKRQCCTVSEVVRAWIEQSSTVALAFAVAAAEKAIDPRQLKIGGS